MQFFDWILLALNAFLSFITAGHALLFKREPKAALGWVSVCLVFPVAGPFLYFLFGINRVRTKAQRFEFAQSVEIGYNCGRNGFPPCLKSAEINGNYRLIARMSDALSRSPLVAGNQIKVLHNGEQAYPSMLECIDNAQEYIFLATYILETDTIGHCFINALVQAAKRGVEVRVIIDGIGDCYSIPRASVLLKKKGIRVARFLPPKIFPPTIHINLRNHRKLLVTDGNTAFTGGMNIGSRHFAGNLSNANRVIDTHFQFKGPVVRQIEQVFLEDWHFVSHARSLPSVAQNIPETAGESICRTIVDGPNTSLNKLDMLLVCTTSSARRSLCIMTPYFLPSQELIAALRAAALRGVKVEILLPEKNNLPFVKWATANMLRELLQQGVTIYYQPPPFVHTKLFIVDNHYSLIGSANMDMRSLRLNFELAVEIYDRAVSKNLAAHFQKCRQRAKQIKLEDIMNRPFWMRVRDALFWLFTPYL